MQKNAHLVHCSKVYGCQNFQFFKRSVFVTVAVHS